MFFTLEILILLLPGAIAAFFLFGLVSYISAKRANKRNPGMIPPHEVTKRLIVFIISLILFILMIVLIIGFSVLISYAVAYM